MPDVIDSFGPHTPYHFCSNFSYYEVRYMGFTWPTNEHAFQGAKTNVHGERMRILMAKSPMAAKRIGNLRSLHLRDDWERAKFGIMGVLQDRKFADDMLAKLLLDTGEAELIEGNTWHDNEWGDCRCGERPSCQTPGANLLGQQLMRVRRHLQIEFGGTP